MTVLWPVLWAKAERLMRFHRRNVFHATAGRYHERAIVRLQRTRTWRLEMAARRDAEDFRVSEEALYLWR